MNRQPSRREAIKTLAAGVALPAELAGHVRHPLVQIATPYRPKIFSAAQFRLIATLVDLIIPPSETPGAAGAGVDRYIDQELAAHPGRKAQFLAGLDLLEQAGFAALAPQQQVDLLTQYSKEAGAAGEFFRLLKDLTVDGYYGTEIGVVKELGYRGNTYLREFPGCRDPEHL